MGVRILRRTLPVAVTSSLPSETNKPRKFRLSTPRHHPVARRMPTNNICVRIHSLGGTCIVYTHNDLTKQLSDKSVKQNLRETG